MRFDLLRPYQTTDAQFLAKLPAAGCFNEQRTGKTPTALAACAMKRRSKILIICPATAIPQWQEEFEKWYELPCIACIGTKARRQKLIRNWLSGGLVISYDTVKTIRRKTKTYDGDVDALLRAHPDAVIIDEAHRIRGRGTARNDAVQDLANIPYKLALTGTPSPSHSYDVWAILHFLYPDYFKSYWKFIEQNYITAKQINPNSGQTYIDVVCLKPGREQWLQKTLNNLSTSRKRKDPEVMPWLPEKDYQPVRLQMTPEQKRYIQELETVWETEHIVTKGVLDRLIRYRQICLAPALLDLPGKSPKLEWISQYLRDYPDRPTLIFSKFTSFLKMIYAEHPTCGVIIGETPVKRRDQYKKAFQRGDIKVLLINIDAGSVALTLDTAEVAIFTDKYPPIGDIDQAEDRFVATTIDKKDKPHVIIELMMRGSYDEHLYKLLRKRKDETAIINNYKSYLERRLQHD